LKDQHFIYSSHACISYILAAYLYTACMHIYCTYRQPIQIFYIGVGHSGHQVQYTCVQYHTTDWQPSTHLTHIFAMCLLLMNMGVHEQNEQLSDMTIKICPLCDSIGSVTHHLSCPVCYLASCSRA